MQIIFNYGDIHLTYYLSITSLEELKYNELKYTA